VTNSSTLTPEQRQRAWQAAYCFSLDQHPDTEIAWEAERWRELGAHGISDLCDSLLAERRSHDFSIPAETKPDALTMLWQRVPRADVLDWVRSGGLCLLAALRMVYWLRQSAEELAA
jgi:hypothetical protein